MYIKKLDIKGFGKINNWSADLTRGINVIYGLNESGKSTIQSFITAMLYGLKGGRTVKDGELPPLKKYKPWRGNDYSGYMEYELGSGDLLRVGRNFESNTLKVFDANFNDLTETINVGKDKKVLLAENQLGINEACFERTVFIRQMAARLQDGNKELQNRLSNIYETGYDDVSFKKAEEALKTAVKRYVGTERTTTRPLDIINQKIDELYAAKKDMEEKRKQVFLLEDQHKQKKSEEAIIRNKRLILDVIKKAAVMQEEAVNLSNKKLELEKIISKISKIDNELAELQKQINITSEQINALSVFSSVDEDDVGILNNDYSRQTALESYKTRLKNEAADKAEELRAAQKVLDSVNLLKSLPGDIENQVLDLNREVENLKQLCNKRPLEELEDKLRQGIESERKYRNLSIIFAVLAGILLAVGFMGWALGFGLFLLPLAGFLGGMILLSKKKKVNSKLLAGKKTLKAEIDSYSSALKEKGSRLAEIYKLAGVSTYEEFLKRYASISSRAEAVMVLNGQLTKLENEILSVDRQIHTARNSVLERLYAAGLIDEGCSIEEKLKQFKDGTNRYKKLESDLVNLKRRYDDLKIACETYFETAVRITGKGVNDKSVILAYIDDLDVRINQLENDFSRLLKEVFDVCDKQGLHEFANMYVNIASEKFYIEKDKLCSDHEALDGKLNEILLGIRETETVIKGLEADDDSLQRLEEEISKLIWDRRQLEDKGKALKLSLDILTEASREIQNDYAPAVNSRICSIIPRITSGRYKNLKADSNLNLKAMAPETGDILNVSSFSGGTIDQMYLAMRIALSDVISAGGEKLPLMLDEVFSQYDDDRTRDTIIYLREEAEARQIILFTCKEREVDLFKEVCKEDLNIIKIA